MPPSEQVTDVKPPGIRKKSTATDYQDSCVNQVIVTWVISKSHQILLESQISFRAFWRNCLNTKDTFSYHQKTPADWGRYPGFPVSIKSILIMKSQGSIQQGLKERAFVPLLLQRLCSSSRLQRLQVQGQKNGDGLCHQTTKALHTCQEDIYLCLFVIHMLTTLSKKRYLNLGAIQRYCKAKYRRSLDIPRFVLLQPCLLKLVILNHFHGALYNIPPLFRSKSTSEM